MEWSGGDGSGVEGREGEGRVPDCLGGLSRVGISSRSTRSTGSHLVIFNRGRIVASWTLHGYSVA